MMRLFTCAVLCTFAIAARAQPTDVSRVGPQVGSRVPAFTAVDQFGKTRTLASLMGPDGLMLVFFRSADW